MNEEKKSKEKEGDLVKDDIIHDYDSVLKESGVLTSLCNHLWFFTKYFYKRSTGIYHRG